MNDDLYKYFPELPADLVDRTPVRLDDEMAQVAAEAFSEEFCNALVANDLSDSSEPIRRELEEGPGNITDKVNTYLSEVYSEDHEIRGWSVRSYNPDTGEVELWGEISYEGESQPIDLGASIAVVGEVKGKWQDELEPAGPYSK